jgi:hypothetical protein
MAEMIITIQLPGPFFDGGVTRDAFHGTTKGAARTILNPKVGFVIPEGRTNEYGNGVYFWEGDYIAGLWWARRQGGRANAVVVRAEVDLGKTFLVNVVGDQLEKIRSDLSAWDADEWKTEEVIRLIVDELRKAKLIDSVKAVRVANKPWDEPERFRAEVVILVFDPLKAKPMASYTEEELLESGCEFTL